MEDTLRYFFSAIFQGFAAILTLGAMFILQLIDRIRTRMDKIEESLERSRSSYLNPEEVIIGQKDGYVEAWRLRLKRVNAKEGDFFNLMVKKYDNYSDMSNEIIKNSRSILLRTIIILVFSAISLFLVGYNDILNLVLFTMGALFLIYSLSYFWNLFKLVTKIISNLK